MKKFKREHTPSTFYTPSATPLRKSRIDRRVGSQRPIDVMQWLTALLLVFCLASLSARAFAASDLPTGNDAANPTVATLQALAGKDAAGELPRTRIETDHQTGEIRFIINGETAAVLSENGLIVDGNVNGHAFLHGSNTGTGDDGSDQAENSKAGGAP